MREPLRVNTYMYPFLLHFLLPSLLPYPPFFPPFLFSFPYFAYLLLWSLLYPFLCSSMLLLPLPSSLFSPPLSLLCSLPHPPQMWAARAALLVHLRRYKEAELELAAFRELDNPDLYYQYHVHSYPGKTGEHLDTI